MMTTRLADAPADNWVDRLLPFALQPYARLARLDRPIGWWLLLLPCWWGLVLAQIAQGGGTPNIFYGVLFFLGAVVMRGAGCTLNDIADREFDSKVARTRLRPIASGQVTVFGGLVFLAALSFVGLIVLLQFNWFTIFVGAASLVVVAIYPLMKRVTYWPQVFLGLAFNWGALVGWSSLSGSLSAPALLLYAGGILWTLAYDTIYAHQDKEDDILIGVKSTALKFGKSSIYWISFFFGATLVMVDAAVWLAGGGLFAHMGVAGAALHAVWQISRLDIDDSSRCLMLFRSNRQFGLIILAGLLIDCMLP